LANPRVVNPHKDFAFSLPRYTAELNISQPRLSIEKHGFSFVQANHPVLSKTPLRCKFFIDDPLKKNLSPVLKSAGGSSLFRASVIPFFLAT
jgi:hypothetical protein